jgi:hypothetical protein
MANICDADLQHLKQGKRVVLRLFNGSQIAAQTISTAENYWQLIGKKADVVEADLVKQRALVKFDVNFNQLGLVNQNEIEDSLWVMIDDLKFVCRY